MHGSRDDDDALTEPPFRAEVAGLGAPIRWRFCFDLALSAKDLWPILVDTTRMNREMGLAPMEYAVADDGAVRGATKALGFPYTWTELPWAWVSGREAACLRIYASGLATRVVIRYTLEPRGDGACRVRMTFDWYPRHGVYAPLFAWARRDLEARYARAFARVAREIGDGKPLDALLRRRAPPLDEKALLAVERSRAAIAEAGVRGEVVEALVTLVTQGDDLDLRRVRVRVLARRWRFDERELLLSCLHATRAGLLVLGWDLICPHCRGSRRTLASLGEIPPRAACTACAAEFVTDGPNAVEVAFRVSPAIRKVSEIDYCLAEASTKTHVRVQQPLAPKERREVRTDLEPGRYRVRIHGADGFRRLDIAEGVDAAPLVLRPGEHAALEAAPRPRLVLENDGDARRTFLIEDVRWADDAIRPADLFTLQEFRDLFATEYLAAEVQLDVGEQTILFTDVVGSTALYEEEGDARAFAAIRRHFVDTFAEVKRRRGAVVKTIGDAVMAVFADPVDALAAAHALARRSIEGPEDVVLKLRVSLNRGTCIAVNLNSGIDYFGRTVNIAAKIQACVNAGQIAFPASLRDDPRVAAHLEEERALLELIELDLPSLGMRLRTCRWDTAIATAEAGMGGAGD